MQGEPHNNRLIHEKSPYLLQHARNPVDWYPWGAEAFKEAKESGKPIFLSIGYATCHWCHMMESESFSDHEIASLMNDTFINIKVDREELPEVDAFYMECAQSMMIGAVGWPLNVVLTPDLKPFFAITYVPPDSRAGLMGMIQVVEQIDEIWKGEDREKVTEQANQIIETFASNIQAKGDEMPDELHISNTAELIYKLADALYGGIKGMPKFPVPCQIFFMLRYLYDSFDGRALFYAERTLDMMQRGGIRDHLGGGFSRYAVDEKWQTPHFEKMIYDNTLLARAYLETWQLTKEPMLCEIAIETLEYLLREMRHPEGPFYCAQDADSDGREGYFYTWEKQEIQEVLGIEESLIFCDFFSVTEMGNFHGRNILHAPLSSAEFAERYLLDEEEFMQKINEQKELLWKTRESRTPPFKDDKVLCAWNGLLIYTLAYAYSTTRKEKFLIAAQQAARFIKTHMWQDGKLLRRWREDDSRYTGTLDDHAFLIHGLLMLYEVDGDTGWLAWSLQLTAILHKDYKAEDGAFYTTDSSDPHLLLQRCEFADGALPSGSGVHCENLLRLHQLTNEEHYLTSAKETLRAVKEYLDGYTPSYCYHLMTLQRYLDEKAVELIIALNDQESHKTEIQDALAEHFIPHKVVIWKTPNDEHLGELLPLTQNKNCIRENTTLYICYNGRCQLPLTKLSDMLDAIKKLG